MAKFIDGKFKYLTSTDRKKIKKAFGEEGYENFLMLNRIGMLSILEDDNWINVEIARTMIMTKDEDIIAMRKERSEYRQKQLRGEKMSEREILYAKRMGYII